VPSPDRLQPLASQNSAQDGSASFISRARVELGILLLILLCLNSSIYLLKQSGPPRRHLYGKDEISLYDGRFDGVKAMLPAHGVVGYIGDPQGESDAVMDYYLTQYALSPLIVDRSAAHHLVIGNFSDANLAALVDHDLTLVRDFGNGVRLYQNAGK
jgi:hypothetical protein